MLNSPVRGVARNNGATSQPAAVAPLRISLLVSDLSERGAGRWGGAVRPFLLSQALRLVGHEVEIVGFGDSSLALQAEVPLTVLSPTPQQDALAAATKLLRHLQGDMIYAYKLKPSSYGLALLDKLRARRPVWLDIDDWELSWHGGDSWRYRPSLRQLGRDLLKPDGALRDPDHPLYLQWLQRAVGWADQVTTHSEFLQQRFGGAYVPNGKDTRLFDPQRYDPAACRAEYGLSEYRVLMFPGAPRPYKGVEDVLTALDLIDEDDLKLVIVGGSPYDDYDSYLHQRWPHRLLQLSKFPYTDMPKLIAAAHVVVVPQRDQPAARAQFPLKLTDGMAMAKPILATRVGDIPKILEDTGYLVEPEAPQALAQQIRCIFQNYGQALERGQLARRRCIAHYSIEAMGHSLNALLGRFSGGVAQASAPLEK